MPQSPFIPPFDFETHILGLWSDPIVAEGTAWTIATCSLVAISCGLLGCFLIVQGLAMIGDAISHTVLLGIVVAFLLTGQFSGATMFLGAAVTGVLTTLLIEKIHSSSRIKRDAAIGIVFSSLFALGVILLNRFASHQHIDADCVLFGDLEVAALKMTTIAGVTLPKIIPPLLLTAVTVLLFLALFYKELLITAFDRQLAAVLGLNPKRIHYFLMALLSVTVVSSFEAVGAILVVAMIIVPPATAYLLTYRLPVMLGLSSLFGVISAVVGTHVAFWLDVSTAGAMVCAACGLFGLAFLFSPRQGVVATAVRRFRLRQAWAEHGEPRLM